AFATRFDEVKPDCRTDDRERDRRKPRPAADVRNDSRVAEQPSRSERIEHVAADERLSRCPSDQVHALRPGLERIEKRLELAELAGPEPDPERRLGIGGKPMP